MFPTVFVVPTEHQQTPGGSIDWVILALCVGRARAFTDATVISRLMGQDGLFIAPVPETFHLVSLSLKACFLAESPGLFKWFRGQRRTVTASRPTAVRTLPGLRARKRALWDWADLSHQTVHNLLT